MVGVVVVVGVGVGVAVVVGVGVVVAVAVAVAVVVAVVVVVAVAVVVVVVVGVGVAVGVGVVVVVVRRRQVNAAKKEYPRITVLAAFREHQRLTAHQHAVREAWRAHTDAIADYLTDQRDKTRDGVCSTWRHALSVESVR